MKKVFIIVFALLIATSVLILGFYLGQRKGIQAGKEEIKTQVVSKLEPLVDLAFPKPPEDIRSFSGTIKAIYGATINLEISDPNDYLPHTDGTPRRTEVRFASVMSSTKITLIDTTKLDAQGNPTKTDMKFSDLKSGDRITVRSNTNIHTAKKFDVTQIEMVRY